VQHYLTMLGSTVLIPSLLVPAMGGSAQGVRTRTPEAGGCGGGGATPLSAAGPLLTRPLPAHTCSAPSTVTPGT